jgi:hypothetical protein
MEQKSQPGEVVIKVLNIIQESLLFYHAIGMIHALAELLAVMYQA